MHMTKWESFFESIAPEIVSAKYPDWPISLRRIYSCGDAPAPALEDDQIAIYDIPDVPGQFGSCLYFLKILDEESFDSVVRSSKLLPEDMAKIFIPIARDGGSEMLLLRNDGSGTLPVWHYSPNFRLSSKRTVFKIADNFDDFLEKVQYVLE